MPAKTIRREDQTSLVVSVPRRELLDFLGLDPHGTYRLEFWTGDRSEPPTETSRILAMTSYLPDDDQDDDDSCERCVCTCGAR